MCVCGAGAEVKVEGELEGLRWPRDRPLGEEVVLDHSPGPPQQGGRLDVDRHGLLLVG
jgi:hypothetical protein